MVLFVCIFICDEIDANQTPAAAVRHRQLEFDNERLRQFYTRRIDEMGRKHDIQLRALKRGSATTTTTSVSTGIVTDRHQRDNSDGLDEPQESGTSPVRAAAAHPNGDNNGVTTSSSINGIHSNSHSNGDVSNKNNRIAQNDDISNNNNSNSNNSVNNDLIREIKSFYTERMHAMEQDLFRTTRELAALKLTSNHASNTNDNDINHDTRISQLQHELTTQLKSFNNERQQLLQQIQASEFRSKLLESEVVKLRNSPSSPASPQMSQFIVSFCSCS